MNLSKRLKSLRAYNHEALSIWDIGCDHGLLGLSFVGEPKVMSINLVDPSKPVIDELITKIKDAYITIPVSLKIHYKKGQEVVLGSEKKTVFIAGMGGKEIVEIMIHLEGQFSTEDRLVISPHRKVLELREWLKHSQFGLLHEEVLIEDGQYYPILCLVRDPDLPRVSAYGMNIWEGQDGQEYLNHQVRFFSRHSDPVSRAYVAYLTGLIKTN